jgi:ubiquinone/menaquinone biosynthesis C-methylase UbiE
MNETARIKERYIRRAGSVKRSTYTYFNIGNLFTIQTRQRQLIARLKRYGCEDLRNKTILEIGCGGGIWLRDFVQWGALPDRIYGVDLIEDRIRIAQRLNPNIHYSIGNAEQLDFPDKTFDVVLLSTCLTSILDAKMKGGIAKETLRVLRDDGIIIWYDFRYNNPKNPDVRGIKKDELVGLFGDCSYCFSFATLAPPISRLLAPISWLACEIISKIRFLNTHYLVIIQKKH